MNPFRHRRRADIQQLAFIVEAPSKQTDLMTTPSQLLPKTPKSIMSRSRWEATFVGNGVHQQPGTCIVDCTSVNLSFLPSSGGAADLSQRLPSVSNDRYATHENTHLPTQRQQHTLPQTAQEPPTRLSTPSSQHKSLRRTPKFDSVPKPQPERRVHIAAASAGFYPSIVSISQDSESSITGLGLSLFDEENGDKRQRRQTSGSHRAPSGSAEAQNPPASSSVVHPRALLKAPRISKHTHSAILYTLEEALRQPHSFTPDEIEESASMSDLMTGGLPAASNGAALGPGRMPAAAPAPTSSPSGIRGPRMIMQERAAREARQRAEAQQRAEIEQQALKKSRAEQEARVQQETERRSAERRAAGVAAGQGITAEAQQSTNPSHLGQAAMDPSQHPRGTTTTAQVLPNQQLPPQQQQQRPVPLSNPQQQHTPPQAFPAGNLPSQQPTSGALPGDTANDPTKPRNSFPHAFERWETLSAHWEGLTSYWIRKLEQNKDDINRDPMSQQLARQVTDLSAAGANLFHAVVELQRLRASSERKFQRWFFETRSELERAHEVNAMLEAALEKERREREQAIREAVDHERGVSKTQKQLVEMRKELSISKEEARRAWEELGRREQEERDRTLSLQSGHPTVVGGVQVVPMTQGGGPSRHSSTREQASYQSDYQRPTYSIEQGTPGRGQSAPGSSGSGQGQYQSGHQEDPSRRTGAGSEGGYSEGEYLIDAQGNFILDGDGHKIPFAVPPSTYTGSDLDPEDYDTPATTNPSGQNMPSSTSAPQGQWTGAYSNPQDYSGQGYGNAGWETVPRHHHPTRLSDVIEEDDERSRTTSHSRI
ncbi:hypothetical protein ACSS6W_010729 [Trichoderma asperelloides]